MTRRLALVIGLVALGLSGPAAADRIAEERYIEARDPSGVPMCFDHAGHEVPLAKCENGAPFAEGQDVSGAPACFDRRRRTVAPALCERDHGPYVVALPWQRPTPRSAPACARIGYRPLWDQSLAAW